MGVVAARLLDQGLGFNQVTTYGGGAEADVPFEPRAVSSWEDGSKQH